MSENQVLIKTNFDLIGKSQNLVVKKCSQIWRYAVGEEERKRYDDVLTVFEMQCYNIVITLQLAACRAL